MKKVRLDLFKLHEENDKSKGSIKIILTSQLKKVIKDIIEEIKEKKKLSTYELSEKLGMRYSTLRMSLVRNRLPLNFVKKLLDFCPHKKAEVIDEIRELSSGTGNTYVRVKTPRFLTENLCKIVGAIIADGNLYLGKNKRKWQIKIGDQYKDNLELLSKWLNREFGVKFKVKKDKKHRMFYIEFSNKIIFKFLNRIFDIKIGSKSSTVGMPNIIKKSAFNYHIAFAIGLCMFDGGIGFGRCNFSLSTKSKKLIEEFNKILNKLDISYSYNGLPNHANGLYQTVVWSKNDLRKILKYLIEPNTTKWRQLYILLNGFKHYNYKNLELVDILYPLQRKSAVRFSDIIKLFKKHNLLTKKEIQLKLNRSERTVRSLLNSLERMKLLKSTVNNSYKVWSRNFNLKEK